MVYTSPSSPHPPPPLPLFDLIAQGKILLIFNICDFLVGILGLRARLEAFDRRIAREVIDDARAREEREQYVFIIFFVQLFIFLLFYYIFLVFFAFFFFFEIFINFNFYLLYLFLRYIFVVFVNILTKNFKNHNIFLL